MILPIGSPRQVTSSSSSCRFPSVTVGRKATDSESSVIAKRAFNRPVPPQRMIPVLPRNQVCADCLNLSAIEYAQLIGAGLFLAAKPASTLQEILGDSPGSIRLTHRLAIVSPVCGGGSRVWV